MEPGIHVMVTCRYAMHVMAWANRISRIIS